MGLVKGLLAACCAMALLSGGAATAAVEGVTDKDIEIGSCLPMSGPLRPRGITMSHAAQCYFNYVNESGGVNGRKIKLTICDDAYSPEKAIECFNGCLKGKVFAGAFFIGAAVIVKYLRMAETSNLPLVGFNVTPPTACELRPSVFVFRPCYSEEIDRLVKKLVDHHITRIAILYQNDALGAGMRQGVIDAMKKHALGEAVANASFNRTGADIMEAYDNVQKANPEVVFIAAGTVPMKAAIERRSKEKWNVPFMTVSNLSDPVIENGTLADGFILSEVIPPLGAKLPTVELYDKLLKKYYPGEAPHIHGLEAFTSALVIVEALKKAGAQLDPTKFIKALESLKNFDTGLGANHQVTFTSSNHVGWRNEVISFAMVKGGKLVPMVEANWAGIKR